MGAKMVLIVHDDTTFVEQVRRGLMAAAPDVEVAIALSAPRALGMVAAETPDVIVVDAELVGVDGYALTQQLKSDPKTKDVPVVIVTLSPSESSALRARQAGAAAHLAATGPLDAIVSKVVALTGETAAPQPSAPAAPAVSAQASSAPASINGFAVPEVTPSAAAVAVPEVPASAPAPAAAVAATAPSPAAIGLLDLPELPEEPAMSEKVAEPMSAVVAAPVASVADAQPGPEGPAMPGYGGPAVASGPAPGSAPFGSCPSSVETTNNLSTDEVPHIDDLLRLMLQRGGSDLHITVGSPPGIRQRGEIIPIENV